MKQMSHREVTHKNLVGSVTEQGLPAGMLQVPEVKYIVLYSQQ